MTEAQVEKAMHYLAETDEPHAKAKALVKGLEQSLKTVKAIAYLGAEGTVAERESQAYASMEYRAQTEAYQNAVGDYELLENKRTRAVLTIDVWRTMEASRRRG
jgi:hypothetical protein